VFLSLVCVCVFLGFFFGCMVDSSTSQAKKYPTQLPSPKSVHLRPQYMLQLLDSRVMQLCLGTSKTELEITYKRGQVLKYKLSRDKINNFC